jgi:hypothetical protein
MPTARIMVIGDSLVKGDDATFGGHRTFRGRLQERLIAGNYLIDFVGSQSLAPAVGGVDPNHEGYALAKIDSGTDNIAGKVATILASGVGVDIIVLMLGWEDVLAGTASIGTKYTTLVDSITTAKPSAKVFMCTLPPYYGKTEVETGSTYASYATLNTAIRAKTGANLYLVDIAALAGSSGSASERQAFVDALISQSKRVSDAMVNVTGNPISDPYGGNRILDAAGIVWRMNNSVPPGTGYNSGPDDCETFSDTTWFRDNFNQIYTWTHAWLAPGHTASNTGVEFRNLCVMVLQANDTWVELISGARIQGAFWNNQFGNQPDYYAVPPGCAFRQQPDGITTFWRCASNTGYSPEGWPIDRVPAIGAPMFNGTYPGVNRAALSGFKAFAVAIQMRLALDDPNGPNDIARAKYLVRAGGADFQTVGTDGERRGRNGAWAERYDVHSFPYGTMDVGGGQNLFLTGSEWQTFGFVSIREGQRAGQREPWYPVSGGYVAPPMTASPYGLTEAQIRANPPPLPTRWTYTGSTSGFPATDYSGTTYLFAQSGADRIAAEIYQRMVSSGWLATYVDSGGSPSQLAPGISSRPKYVDQKTSTLWTYADTENAAAPLAPAWITNALGPASVGTAYSFQLQAGGSPAATYSILSGAPGWMSCSGAGLLTGTPTGGDASYTITFRATNASGTVDIVLVLLVYATPVITTTSLPNSTNGAAYFQPIAVSGSGPFTLTVQSGTLPTGVSISGQALTGSTTANGTFNFTIRATSPAGAFDDQAYTVVVAAAGSAPVITSTSIASGVVGSSLSRTLTATGASITWSASGLPPGTSLTPSTGVITGTPTQAGSYIVTVTATNTYGAPTAQLPWRIDPTAPAAPASPWTRYLRR